VELIAVIAIVVIIAGLTVPAVSRILRGSQLTQASGMIVGQLSLARQHAMTRNRPVEVRFYRFADPEMPGETSGVPSSGKFRALQLFEVLENGVALPLSKIEVLPQSVIFAYAGQGLGVSSLIDLGSAGTPKRPGSDDKAAPALPRGVGHNYEYVAFRFLQDGSTNLRLTDTWYLTLVGLTDRLKSPAEPPPNYFTVQINPVSGSTRTFRPNAG
jgi:uncharacterized protein (TIGR02596 family)